MRTSQEHLGGHTVPGTTPHPTLSTSPPTPSTQPDSIPNHPPQSALLDPAQTPPTTNHPTQPSTQNAKPFPPAPPNPNPNPTRPTTR
ncbi:unnamed protein product [Gadus morhua 'NCC']